MGQEVVVESAAHGDNDAKEVTYTSNEDDESYEPDF